MSLHSAIDHVTNNPCNLVYMDHAENTKAGHGPMAADFDLPLVDFKFHYNPY
jgi:hypothetical protein